MVGMKHILTKHVIPENLTNMQNQERLDLQSENRWDSRRRNGEQIFSLGDGIAHDHYAQQVSA